MDEFDARLGAAWTAPEPWAFLTELTDIGSRMAGSTGERRAAELVAEAFSDAGLTDVRRESFGMQAWERGTASVRTANGREFACHALPYSPAGEVTAPLVDVGHGTPEEIADADCEGRVVVASTTTPPGSRFIHRMEKYGTAVEAGAAAFVFTNHLPGQLPPTGSLTYGERAAIPAVGVSKETGDRLREYADRGTADHGSGAEHRTAENERDATSDATNGNATSDATNGNATSNETNGDATNGNATGDEMGSRPTAEEVTVRVDATTTAGESHNVHGRTGPTSDRELLVVAHHDAHDIAEGALDNGCGITTLVTAARLLAGTDLARGVRFVGVGSEEVGLLGAEALAESLDPDAVAGVVNLDGAGRFRNVVAMSHTSAATADAARTVAERTGHPIEVEERPHPFSDQWPFVRRGVPAVQLHSTPDEPSAAIGGLAGDRGRGWGHTDADTRDKVDRRNLREHAMLTAILIRELATRELPRLDLDETRAAFREANYEIGMRAADLWPEAWNDEEA